MLFFAMLNKSLFAMFFLAIYCKYLSAMPYYAFQILVCNTLTWYCSNLLILYCYCFFPVFNIICNYCCLLKIPLPTCSSYTPNPPPCWPIALPTLNCASVLSQYTSYKLSPMLTSNCSPTPVQILLLYYSLLYSPWNLTALTICAKCCCWCNTKILGNITLLYSHAAYSPFFSLSNRRHALCDNLAIHPIACLQYLFLLCIRLTCLQCPFLLCICLTCL